MAINKKTAFYLVALISVYVFIYPALKSGIWLGHDISAHISRLMATNSEIQNGQYPFLFDFFNKYQFGYSWNIYYPPLSSFIFAATYPLHALGASVYEQFKTTSVIIIIICYAVTFVSVKNITNSSFIGFLTATIFTTSVYSANNFYIRASTGEMLAYSLLPSVICSYIKFRDNCDFRYIYPISLSLILLSNIPSFLVCSIFILLMSAIDHRSLLSANHLKQACKIAVCFLLLTSFYTIPLIWSRIHDNIWAFNGLALDTLSMWKSAASLSSIITGDDKIITTAKSLTSSQRSIGAIMVFMFVVSAFVYRKKGKFTSLLVSGLLSVFLATSLFPWYSLSNKIPLIGLIQFPWRFFIVATFAASLMCSKIIALTMRKNAYISILIFFSLCLSSSYTTYNAILKNVDSVYPKSLFFRDYMPANAIHKDVFTKKDSVTLDGIETDKVDLSITNGYPSYIIHTAFKNACLPIFTSSLLVTKLNNAKVNQISNKGYMCIESDNKKQQNNINIHPHPIIYAAYFVSIATLMMMIFLAFRRR